ncbi:MAG: uroporphyrinogen decarboxylase family protein [Clostridia bacterium]
MKTWLSEMVNLPQKQAFPLLSFPSVTLMGITIPEFIMSSKLQAKGMKAIVDHVPTLAAMGTLDMSLEAERFGCPIRITDREVPMVARHIVKNEAQAEELSVPDVAQGRTKIAVEAARLAAATIKDRRIFASCIGPYSLTGRLMGVSELMIDCYENPKLVHTIMKKSTEFLIHYIHAFKQVGAHAIIMAEPLTGLLPLTLAEEFSTPYVKQICEAVRDRSFLLIYHNCGNSTIAIIKSILSIGADAYHFGNAINMEKMLQIVPSDTIMMGNLDPVLTLLMGTPESVYQETMQLLQVCCRHQNYVISTGCDVPVATPWENIDAFFYAIEAYNRAARYD